MHYTGFEPVAGGFGYRVRVNLACCYGNGHWRIYNILTNGIRAMIRAGCGWGRGVSGWWWSQLGHMRSTIAVHVNY